MFDMLFKLLPLLILGGSVVSAENVFWIVSLAPLVTTRLDPIITPGKVSAHVHAFVGASNLAPVHDYNRLQESQCTTANVGADKSNYWVPQLYRKSNNGSLTLMPLSYTNVYYQLRKQPNEPVYEFPAGFRMVAGDPSRSTFDPNDNRQTAINYNCLNFAGGGGPETNGFPDRSCPNDLRAQVRFPACWDGVHAWLPGGAHMAYGAGAHDGNGKCPDTHPYRTMSLFYEYHFKDDFPYEAGARVWATGDTTGYSFHGDFANGWPEGMFTDIWAHGNECDAFFDPKKCPPLAPSVQTNGGQCKYPGITVDEDIGRGGGLAALPGNNPQYGSGGPQRPAGYTENARMVDASGATVQPQDVGSGPIFATVRRRGIVRGDPGTAAVEQLSGGGGETPVAPVSSSAAAVAAPSSAAAASAASSASVAASVSAPAPVSSAPASAASAAATRPINGGNVDSGNNGNVGIEIPSSAVAVAASQAAPTGSPSPAASSAAPAAPATPTSSKAPHKPHGHHEHSHCRRSRWRESDSA